MIWWSGWSAAATLSGVVVDEAGAPIEGAAVWAYGVLGTVGPSTTAEDGVFTLTIVEGDWRIYTIPPADVSVSSAWNLGDFSECAADVLRVEGDLVLDRPVTLPASVRVSGTLQNAAGVPVEGVEISLYPDAALPVVLSGATDADGRFSIDGVPAGQRVSASVGKYGAVPDQWLGGDYETPVTWAFSADTDVGTFRLRDGITVEGVITGPDGPVAGAAVYVYSGGQAVGTLSGDDGSYVADGLPIGEVILWASADGLATTYYPGVAAPGASVAAPLEGGHTQVDLRLPSQATLTVQLLGDGALDGISGTLYNAEYTVAHVRTSDDDGRITFDGLWPGDWYLATRGGDFVDEIYGGSATPTPLDVDGDTVTEVALSAGGAVSGRVVDERGVALPTGEVLLLGEDGSEATGADDDGVWEARGVAPGWTQLEAYGRTTCPQDPGWTMTWWEAARTIELAGALDIEAGEAADAGDLAIWRDADLDGMGDAWEDENGLDATRADASEDPDEDGYTNVREWQLDTDPTSERVEGCGCTAGPPPGAAALLLALLASARRRR